MAELPTDSESEFSLPSVAELSGADSDGQPVVSWACGCRDGPCVTPGSPLHLHCEGLRASMQEQSSEAHRKTVWLMLHDLRVVKGKSQGFELNSVPVCRGTFCKACSIGKGTLQNLLRTVHDEGPPPDGRKAGLRNHGKVGNVEGQNDCEKFFFAAWGNWAMHIPVELVDGDEIAALQESKATPITAVPTSSCRSVSGMDDSQKESDSQGSRIGLADPVDAVGPDAAKPNCRRYMPNMSFQEFYEMYVNWSDNPVSLSSFRRYYEKSWKDMLRIARSTDHGKCSICEKLKMLRKSASLEEQAQQIQAAHGQHVRSVMADRQVDAQCEQLGCDSVNFNMAGCPKVARAQTLLNWTQDHMDQAKFRVPRNTSLAKCLKDSWRPQIGAGGVIVDGVGKFLYLTDQDMGKNSDMQCTMTSRALEVTSLQSVRLLNTESANRFLT